MWTKTNVFHVCKHGVEGWRGMLIITKNWLIEIKTNNLFYLITFARIESFFAFDFWYLINCCRHQISLKAKVDCHQWMWFGVPNDVEIFFKVINVTLDHHSWIIQVNKLSNLSFYRSVLIWVKPCDQFWFYSKASSAASPILSWIETFKVATLVKHLFSVRRFLLNYNNQNVSFVTIW